MAEFHCFKGKSLVFWSRTYRNFGYFFSTLLLHEYVLISIPRGPSPKTKKDVEPCVFLSAYARNEHVPFFTLRVVC